MSAKTKTASIAVYKPVTRKRKGVHAKKKSSKSKKSKLYKKKYAGQGK